MDNLTGLLLWGGSRLTCILKTNSPCLSSHDEDVNTFQFYRGDAIFFNKGDAIPPHPPSIRALFTTQYSQNLSNESQRHYWAHWSKDRDLNSNTHLCHCWNRSCSTVETSKPNLIFPVSAASFHGFKKKKIDTSLVVIEVILTRYYVKHQPNVVEHLMLVQRHQRSEVFKVSGHQKKKNICWYRSKYIITLTITNIGHS